MGIEEQIALRLQQGSTPRDLLAEGFRKSTVYKVAESLRSQRAPIPTPLVGVQMECDRDRYLPGEAAQVSFVITNSSVADLYVFQAGVRPEWLEPDQWIPTGVRKLVGSGDSLTVRLLLPIPSHIALGEKELLFGIQGQWVGPRTASPANEMMWTGALLLPVQRAPNGSSVFIAHSVADMALVARLERVLDDNGIATIIAGPDVNLQALDRADFLVALITHSIRLQEALSEIARAAASRKELILLRDVTLAGVSPPELAGLGWTDLDFSRQDVSIVVTLIGALHDAAAARNAARKKDQQDALGAIVLGLAGLVAGIAIAKGGAS